MSGNFRDDNTAAIAGRMSAMFPPDKDHADEQNAYARLIKVTVPSRLTVLSFHSNIAQQNCIFHGDFLSNAEPSRASPEKTS